MKPVVATKHSPLTKPPFEMFQSSKRINYGIEDKLSDQYVGPRSFSTVHTSNCEKFKFNDSFGSNTDNVLRDFVTKPCGEKDLVKCFIERDRSTNFTSVYSLYVDLEGGGSKRLMVCKKAHLVSKYLFFIDENNDYLGKLKKSKDDYVLYKARVQEESLGELSSSSIDESDKELLAIRFHSKIRPLNLPQSKGMEICIPYKRGSNTLLTDFTNVMNNNTQNVVYSDQLLVMHEGPYQ